MNPEEILKKQLEKLKSIAFKNGWETGKHIFNYLDETQMMQYDNIQEELVILKTRQEATEEIQKKVFEEIEKLGEIRGKDNGLFAITFGESYFTNSVKMLKEHLKQSLQNIFNSPKEQTPPLHSHGEKEKDRRVSEKEVASRIGDSRLSDVPLDASNSQEKEKYLKNGDK